MWGHSEMFLEKSITSYESCGLCVGKKTGHPDWGCLLSSYVDPLVGLFLHCSDLLGIVILVFSCSQGVFEVKHIL